MPMAQVTLKSGVNTEFTPAQNESGITTSQLIRTKAGLTQKYGGWKKLFPFTVGSTAREVWGWRGLTANDKFLGIGTPVALKVYEGSIPTVVDVTPQTTLTNSPINFTVSSGSKLVTVVDIGSSTGQYDTIYLNTPVSVGGLLLNGAYKINTAGGTNSYTILSSLPATTSVNNGGAVPKFDTQSGQALVTVTLPNHGFSAITGLFQQFIAPTQVGGLVIQGQYQVNTVIDSTSFTIVAPNTAQTTATAPMNVNDAQFLHYVTVGPPPPSGGFGIGPYGGGGYGTGTAVVGATGTPITASDWTLVNWGELLLACPTGGPIYLWAPDQSFTTASVIPTAPFFNGGIFIAQPQQQLVCWGSVQSSGVQDALVVRWSDYGDYTQWAVTAQTAAGSFHIPTGSVIRGGMQAPYYGVIWTDIDAWIMSYVGGQIVYNFTRIGSGCGLVGPHAMGVLNGTVFWCGIDNFFAISGNGVQAIPCPVWDAIFQNLNQANAYKVRCAPNSIFGEITWFYPSLNSTENDSYVKLNVLENAWDYGLLSRTAWTDVTALGNPIGVDSDGFIMQHEIGNDADTVPMNSSFRTGFWRIAQGEDFWFVDYIIPDMKFGLFAGATPAQVNLTFYAVDYLGDTPRTYGPYTFNSATQYINTRIRGRFLAMQVDSADAGSFWRLGQIRYRAAQAGRR